MAKREREPIRVEAYVTVNGAEVNVDDLTPRQREELATWLKLTYLGELWRGKAEFFTKGENTA